MMLWFAEATSDNIVGNAYTQWGFLGVLVVVIIFVGRYLLKQISDLKDDKKTLTQEIKDLQTARLQDAKDFAAIKAQPTEELVRFVRSLYDGDSNKRGI